MCGMQLVCVLIRGYQASCAVCTGSGELVGRAASLHGCIVILGATTPGFSITHDEPEVPEGPTPSTCRGKQEVSA